MRIPKSLVGFVALLAGVSCSDGHLRGSVESSSDGGTYLVFTEGNNCDPIRVDGAAWPFAIGQPGKIDPGDHLVECNGEIRFNIPAGTTFRFSYWGP